MQYHGKAT